MIPDVRPPKRLRLPAYADRTLPNGLRVLAIRKPIVPRVEIRVRIPAGRAQDGTANGARAMLLAGSLLTGTSSRTALEIAETLQRLGAALDVSCGPDDLILQGGVLKEHLPTMLELMREVVTDPTFPSREIDIAADRLAQQIEIIRSQAAGVAGEAVMARAFGSHRYGRTQPDPDRVRKMKGAALRAFASGALTPRGASVILVGDLQPERAIDQVAAAMADWRSEATPGYLRSGSPAPSPRPLLIDRPGSVQTNIRLVLPAVGRNDPSYPALLLGETILSGYFTSRLVRNIRETRGYCYSCGSRIEVRRLGPVLHLAAPVGVEVTAPALREIRYEMTRMVTEEVEPVELTAAKAYLSGQALLSLQTQGSLADAADALLGEGGDLTYLETYATMLHQVTSAEILEAAQRFLSPALAATVLVGDVSGFRASLEVTDDVEISTAT